jgi:NitT/TauT family transport system substrate-binding protein
LQNNPEEAGVLGSQIEELGFEAAAVTESIKNTQWDFVQVKDCRTEIESFLLELSKLEPSIIGGQLPDEGLYYEGVELD